MKNRFILVILFLFISPTLFAAREVRKRRAKEDSVKWMEYKKELCTAQLQQLLEKHARWDSLNNKNKQEMKKLIKNGAKVDEVIREYLEGESFFSYACGRHDFGLVRACVASGASLEIPDKEGKTALFSCSHVPILKYLLELGVDVNHRDNSQKTALINAVESYYSTGVIELLSRYIAPSFRDSIHIPLYYGCQNNKNIDNFELRAAVLLWCSKFQFDSFDSKDEKERKVIANWLRKEHSGRPNFSIYKVIKKNIDRAYEEWQHEESEKTQHIIENFLERFFSDNHNITNIVRNYSGPSPVSYIPLRDLMKRKGSKQQYPAVAPLFYTKGIFSRLIS